MKERYWLRHHSLSGHVGPLLAADLEAAVRGGSLPAAGEALLDEGQDAAARERAVWTKVSDLFGLPPAAATSAAPPEQSVSPERAFLLARRRNTAYAPLRLSIEASTALAAFVNLLVMIPWPSHFDRLSFTIVCEFLLHLAVLLVIRGVLHLVVDFADSRLARDLRGSGEQS